MSGFGLGQIDFEADDDTEDIDRSNPEEWPEFDWTPNDGDLEDGGIAPEPPADNVQDETVSTAPGSNLLTAPSFESVGTWTGWETPFPWDFAYHGSNVARVSPAGSLETLTTEQRIPISTADTYWASGWGWMERYTSGSARMLLHEYDAYGAILDTHVVGEWDSATGHFATLLAINPSSYWRLGEASGSYLDSIGSVPGTAVGTHARDVTGVLPADSDGATRLPGSIGAYIDLGDAFDFAGNSAFSVAGWVKSEDFTGSMRLMGKESASSPDSGWYIGVESGTYAKFVRYNNDEPFTEYELRNTPEDPFEAGIWYHICAIWDGVEGFLYVNAVNTDEDPTGDQTVTLLDSTTTARIGADWDGDIDEVAIWQYALSADEVRGIYDSRLAQWQNQSVRFRSRALTLTDVAWSPDTENIGISFDTTGNPVFDFRFDGTYFAAGEQAPTGAFTDAVDHAPEHAVSGDDPLDVTTLAGYPGGATTFLRDDGTFAVPSSSDSYQHNQGSADTTWTVNHNLARYPAVTILDSALTEVEAQIDHTNLNQVVITLASAISGTATCS